MPIQNLHLRSNVQGKEPVAGSATGQLPVGSIAINYNEDEPFLSIQDSGGNIRRIAGIKVGATAPATPTAGETWLDTTITTKPVLKVFDGTAWVGTGSGTSTGGTQPTTPLEGDLWVDTSVAGSPVLKVYDGAAWVVVTPDATTTAKGIVQLADATAVTAGTAGLVVDAAQLKTVADSVSANDEWTRTGTVISQKTDGDSLVLNDGTGTAAVSLDAGASASPLVRDASGNIDIGSGGVYYDAATKRLGIGTTTPSRRLHVNSGSTDTAALFYSSDSGVYINFQDSTSAASGVTIGGIGDDLRFGSGGGGEFGRFDSSGRLGVGTSSVQSLMHVAKNQATGDALNWVNSQISISSEVGGNSANNRAALYFAPYGSDNNYAPAAIAGFPEGNSASSLRFYTNVAGNATGQIESYERMRIDSAGGVFIDGATSAVAGNPNEGIHVSTHGSHLSDFALTLGDGAASGRWRVGTGSYNLNFDQNDGSGTYVNRSYITNSTGAYVATSDERAKKLITNSDYGIDQIKQLRPVSYLMNDQDEATARRNLGFIAQEVKDVVPEAVITPEDPTEQFYGLEHSALIPVLTKALQEAVAKIETLEAKVAALEAN